jgi:hypothetical protein
MVQPTDTQNIGSAQGSVDLEGGEWAEPCEFDFTASSYSYHDRLYHLSKFQ